MKQPFTLPLMALLGGLLLSGCVNLPPVVQVKHESNTQVLQRLEAIDQRLDRLEKKADDQMREELRILRSEVESLRSQGEE